MSNIFYRFSPFIQDYIYRNGWQQLRGVQTEAARVIFDTDHNLLLSSATASGKTEAAFFPILSMMYDDPPSSFGALYIAPLKSLINDQFSRLEELLDLTGIKAFHWHGDVAQSHKSQALKNPSGILQITPESLESMLINRSNDIPRLFGDLRFIILDEVHTLTGSDRGNQILSQLARIQRLIGRVPRRIGLSATLGNIELAAEWLGAGTDRITEAPKLPQQKISWRLGLEHFYIQQPDQNSFAEDEIPESAEKKQNLINETSSGQPQINTLDKANTENTVSEKTNFEVSESALNNEIKETDHAATDPGFEYIYDCTKQRKCLVFSNSREETEYLTATLRQIAERRGDPDIFLIHHGNLSASLREEAELRLKNDEQKTVTCATVTLELGIDIGKLERIVHLESPHSVSSFLQRLGRSGRRGAPSEMMMVFREENPLPNTPLPQLMPWELLRAIAIIQLYLEERFIEPPTIKKLPFSLLFQQTLSVLAASGECTPKQLAERMLALPPFVNVSKEDFKLLLISMIKNEFIEMTEEKGLIVGLYGERLINSFKFYAVFKDSEDYTVRCQSDEIGTITTPPPVGDRFALAGKVWEVEELDIQRKLIYVKPVKGKMEVSWPGDYGEIHTKILRRMRQVLIEDTVYPYLKPNAKQRLEAARHVARSTKMTELSLIPLGGYTWCLFPWLGTRSFRTLRKYIAKSCKNLGVSNIDYEGCYYMTFKMENGKDFDMISQLYESITGEGINTDLLVSQTELPVFEKYDNFIPGELLRRAYTTDRLRTDEIDFRIKEMMEEYRK